MRKCDYCAQEVQDEAVYCRHCHRELGPNEFLPGKKRCPYCAEWIERGAVICPYCAKDLVPSGSLRRPSRLERLTGLPRPWDPRDVLRSGPSEEPAPKAPAEGERRGLPLLGKKASTPFEPPLDLSTPLGSGPFEEEEGPSPGRPSIFRRLLGTPEEVSPPSQPVRTPRAGSAWVDHSGAPESPAPLETSLHPEGLGWSGDRALADEQPAKKSRARSAILAFSALVLVAVAYVLVTRLPDMELGALFGARGQGTPSPTSASAPTLVSTVTPEPSATTPVILLPTGLTPSPGPGDDCILWDKVTLQNTGETLCVYGEVLRWFKTETLPFVALFSNDPGTFIIMDRTTPHADVHPGDCIMVVGEVESMSRTRPVIDASGELLFCQ